MIDEEIEREVLGYIPARQRMTNGKSTLSVDRKDRDKFIKMGFKPEGAE